MIRCKVTGRGDGGKLQQRPALSGKRVEQAALTVARAAADLPDRATLENENGRPQ